jgi:hypothetical protein
MRLRNRKVSRSAREITGCREAAYLFVRGKTGQPERRQFRLCRPAPVVVELGDRGLDLFPVLTLPANRATLFGHASPNYFFPTVSITSQPHPQDPPNPPASLKSKGRCSLAGSAAAGVPCSTGRDRSGSCLEQRPEIGFVPPSADSEGCRSAFRTTTVRLIGISSEH